LSSPQDVRRACRREGNPIAQAAHAAPMDPAP
jgi:hypothetical protein